MSTLDFVRRNIREMDGYVSGEQPAAGKYIKLNTNENPFSPSDRAIDAIHDAASNKLNVYPDASSSLFRRTAAELLGVEPANIICGNGSDDILTILTRTFVSPGTKVRIPYPSYILYRTLAEIQSASTEEVHFDNDWKLPVEFKQADENLSLVFLPNPNSPSGTTVSNDQILEIAKELNCPLVVDEAYADFASSNAIELFKECDNIIVTRTLSKSYGLAGLRFGFAIASEPVIEQLFKVKDSYNCDALSIAGATAAIADRPWFDENRKKILEIRGQLYEGLRQLGFETVPSEANFVWCRHPDHESRFLYEQLKQNRILVRFMDYPNWGDGLRISVGTENQISALFTILESIISG